MAVYMGIINGYADGSFGPNNPVTYAEAVAMLIRGVPGHAAQVGAGIWPYNFLFYGVDSGFTGGVDVGFANLPYTRGDMAQMMVATMQINKLSAKGEELDGTAVLYEGYEDIDPSPDLEVWEHAGNLWTGTFTGFHNGVADIGNANGSWHVALGDKVWLAGAANYADLLNQPVFIAENADGGFFIWVTGESNVVTGVLANPLSDADDDGEPDCFVLADGTKVPYTEGQCLIGTINHQPGRCRHELEQNPGADIAIAVGPDGVAVNFSVTQFDSMFEDPTPHFFVVLDVLPEDPTYDAANPDTWMLVISTDHSFAPVPRTCQVTLNGQPSKITDLKVGDVIDAAIERETAVSGYYPPFIIRAHREVVEGNVAGTSTSYPGPIDRVTMDLKAGGSKTYVVDRNGTVGGPRPGGPATSSSATGALPMAPRSSSSRISPLCLAKAGDLRTAL